METNLNNKEERDKLKKKNGSAIKKGFVWRPVPTIFSTTMCFLISGLVFLVVGAVLLYMTSQIQEFLIVLLNGKVCLIHYLIIHSISSSHCLNGCKRLQLRK